MPAKGQVLTKQERARISVGKRRAWAIQRAMGDAGQAVLAAAILGDADKIAEVAREQLAAIQEQFGDDLGFRLVPRRDAA